MSETALQTEPEVIPPVDALDEPAGLEPLDPREAIMEEIAATRRDELREDGLEIPPDDAGEAEDGETPPPEPEGVQRARGQR